MDIESVRAYCLSFPHATENVQWGNDLVFKIAGKMFAVGVLEGASKYCLSLKCTEEKFAELIEQGSLTIHSSCPYNRFMAAKTKAQRETLTLFEDDRQTESPNEIEPEVT